MDPEMTLGALSQEGLSPTGLAERIVGVPPGRQCFRMSQTQTSGMKMGFVALKTKEGLVLLEQVVCHRAVGIVANSAVFENGSVFEDKRALFVPVAVETEVIEPFCRFQVIH
jgi:hypothetical protein